MSSDVADAVTSFDRGTAIASIAERFETSALGDFDVTAHTKTIRRFTASTRTIRHELRHAIPAEVLAQRSFDADASAARSAGCAANWTVAAAAWVCTR